MKRLANGRYQVRWRDATGEQRAKNFKNKEVARDFEAELRLGKREDEMRPKAARQSQTFADVLADWKRDRYPSLSPTSRVRYDNLLRLYFDRLLPVPIGAFTAQTVDEWIRWMKDDPNRFKKGGLRTSFHHEVTLLRAVLNYFVEYRDPQNWAMPVKRRHFVDCKLRNRRGGAPKDLGEEHFLVFRQRLEERFGVSIAALATLQYYQALRVSEAVALDWKDVHFDPKDPARSRLVFSQHVLFTRSKDTPDTIEPGLKNSDEGKEHPMLPEVYGMLRRLYRPGARGLVFTPPEGSRQPFFSYRQVQFRYTTTFRELGLPYQSTHVMRHGGTRKVFDETGGDVGIAAQQLGNASEVKRYAQRSVVAFTTYAQSKWVSARKVHSTGEA